MLELKGVTLSLYMFIFYRIALNFGGRRLLANLVVHDRSTKVLCSNNFILVGFLCKAANPPMFFCQNVLGSNMPKFSTAKILYYIMVHIYVHT